jgi:transcriptional regulator with XRE-family HTH domain
MGTMKLSRTSLGLAVRTAREAARLTPAQLVDLAGIDRSALSRVENGIRALEFSEAVAIAEAVGIDVERLRTLAETFEREGVHEKRVAQRDIERELNSLQRLAMKTAIELTNAD